MDPVVLEHMAVQIALGQPKGECPYVTDAESSKVWDEMCAEIKAAQAAGKGIDVPYVDL